MHTEFTLALLFKQLLKNLRPGAVSDAMRCTPLRTTVNFIMNPNKENVRNTSYLRTPLFYCPK